MSTHAVATPSSSPLLRFALRNFVIYNPLFLFSAALVLGGAWLLNPPAPGHERSIPLLFQLLGVVQLYEVTLLGAALVLARRANVTRDVRNLALVLAPFLLDVTFTTSSLNAALLNNVDTWQSMLGISALVALVLLPFTWLKLRVAAHVTGHTFTTGQWAALLAGPVLVTLTPLVSAFLPLFDLQSEVAFLGGLSAAALALVLGALSDEASVGGRVLRRLAPLVLGGVLVHACANSWAYDSSLSFVFGPLLVALGVALPRLAWPEQARDDTLTPLVLPLVGAALLGWSGESALGLNAWHLGLAGVAAIHGVMLYRHGAPQFLAGVLVAAHLAWGGDTPLHSLGAVGENAVEPLLLLALFGYGLYRKAHPVTLAVPLGLAALLTARLAPCGNALDAVLALDLIAAGILAWTHRVHGRSPAGAGARFVATFLLVVPITTLGLVEGDTYLTGWLAQQGSRVSLLALLALAVVTRQRLYALPALLIPLQVAVQLAPTSSAGWGVVGLLAAFAVVCLGVVVSLQRERILAWLERGESRETEAGQRVLVSKAGSEAWLGQAAVAVGLVLALGWVLVPVL